MENKKSYTREMSDFLQEHQEKIIFYNITFEVKDPNKDLKRSKSLLEESGLIDINNNTFY